MGLFRLLFWIALIAAAFWVWRRFIRPPSPPGPSADQARPMVRCAHCGIHIPQEHALAADQRWYCSQAHLEQGPNTGGH